LLTVSSNLFEFIWILWNFMEFFKRGHVYTHHYFWRVGSVAVEFIGYQETFTVQLGLEGKIEVL